VRHELRNNVVFATNTMNIDPTGLRDLGARYTAAWCSREPQQVVEFFSESGSLTINGGPPAIGRGAITEVAASFMTAFPNLILTMDDLRIDGEHVIYLWTFVGTNTGPGGAGQPVRFSGSERWEFDEDGLIATSLGTFDEADYRRQLSP
jgi:predicted ester cyclase